MYKRILTVFTVTLLVLLLGSLLAACGGAKEETVAPTPEQETSTPAMLDGKTLVEEQCSKCHGLEQVTRARKTEEEWKATVERMVKKGAKLDQAEQEVVVKYLQETYPK